jgi:hypothetical protein
LFSASAIDSSTIQAYLETEFKILGEVSSTLRIGMVCPELTALHEAHRTDCSAFITACNPFSQEFSETANAEGHAHLARELKRRSLTFVDGIGQHPSNQWPGEESFLVLGLTLESAKKLGIHFEQNAIVWIGSDAVPQLVMLR